MSTNTKSVFVLDGGFSSQVLKYEDKFQNHPLWCSLLLYKSPEVVYQTHLDYLRAGADIIETNTYQASIPGYQKYLQENLSEIECKNLISKAVQLAKQARDVYLSELKEIPNKKILIAGSIGPFGAFLHDYSEYTGSYINNYPIDEIREWHRPRIETLLASGVDLLAIETMPVSQEAEMLCELLKEYPDAKAWLSFTCKDGESIKSGENFQTVAKRCYDSNPEQIIGIGVNCCQPEYIEKLIQGFNDDRVGREIALIVYPNSGESFDKEKGWIGKDESKSPETFVKTWIDLGVKYIGGCCRINAEDIKKIREEVDRYAN